MGKSDFSEAPIVLFELSIGANNWYWSTTDIANISGASSQYDGRVVESTTIDRSLRWGGPVSGDVTLTLSNADGGLDGLVSSFTDANNNILLGEMAIKRGFSGDAYGNFKQVASFEFAQLVGGDAVNRTQTMRFIDKQDAALGFVDVPTVSELLSDLASNVGSPWDSGQIVDDRGDEVVALVSGAFTSLTHEDGADCLPALRPQVFLQDTKEYVWLVAVSYDDFDVTSTESLYEFVRTERGNWLLIQDAIVHGSPVPGSGGSDSQGAGVGRQSLNYSGTKFVMVHRVRAGYVRNSDEERRFPAYSDRSDPINEHVTDVISGVVNGFTDTTYGSEFDVGSSNTAKTDTIGYDCRLYLKERITAVEFVRRICQDYWIDIFWNSDGKLAYNTLSPPGSGGTVSTSVELSEEHDVLALRYKHGKNGARNGIINEAMVTYRVPFLAESRPSFKVENSTSKTNHGDAYSIEISSDFFPSADVARIVAQRVVVRYRNPRAILDGEFPLIAQGLELGDLIEITHSGVPGGFSSGRYCLIEGIRDDLINSVIGLTLVDYNNYVTSAIYYLDDESDWHVMDGAAGETLDFTSGVADIDYSFTSLDEADIEVGDILSVGSLPGSYRGDGVNNLESRITAVDTGSNTITIADASKVTDTESGVTAWSILRGQTNRDTDKGDYTARDSKYGTLAGSDGDFSDDTAAYIYPF